MEHLPSETSDVDEVALMRAAASGDRSAFDRVVVLHQDAVWRFARALVRDAAMAEDVMQETFISAYRYASTFRGESGARSWLLSIARRAAFRLRRSARDQEPTSEPSLEQLGARAGWGDDTPERLAGEHERHQRLLACVQRLPEHEREVLVLRDIEGLDGPAVAESLGLELATMKTRLHRARLRVMGLLREEMDDGA